MRSVRWLWCCLLLLIAAGPARADIKSNAEAVIAAHEAGDNEKLAKLGIPVRGLDPWTVADHLIALGKVEIAQAYADLSTTPDCAALPAYVKAQGAVPIDQVSRDAHRTAMLAFRDRDLEAALAALQQVSEKAHPVMRLRAADGIAALLRRAGKTEAASASYEAAAREADKVGWLAEASTRIHLAAVVAMDRGEFRRARRLWQYRLDIEERREAVRAQAAALGNMGMAHWRLGNLPKAVTNLSRASVMLDTPQSQGSFARAIYNLALVRMDLGEFSRALADAERARRIFETHNVTRGLLATMSTIASAYRALGDDDAARMWEQRVLKLPVSPKDRLGLVLNAASQALRDGDAERAKELLAEVAPSIDVENHAREAVMLNSVRGDLAARAGDHQGAIKEYEAGIEIAKRIGLKRELAVAQGLRAALLAKLGRTDEAIASMKRAVREGERLRSPGLVLNGLQALAATQLAEGDNDGALASARRSVPWFEKLVQGHGQEASTHLREKHTGIYDHGAAAAVGLEDPEEAFFFLESGRAGALLEALGGRDVLKRSLPDELMEEETLARRAVQSAQTGYMRAADTGNRKATKKASAELKAAQDELRRVVGKIQQHEKENARSRIFYPTPTTIESLQDMLREGEAFVTYGIFKQVATALVVTQDEARTVSLGPTAPIAEACEAIELGDPDAEVEAALAPLRELVVKPLGMEKTTTRVLVSPHGPLSYVPARLLFETEVVYQPSATAYLQWREEKPLAGKGVLALGDPQLPRGSKLPQLPGSREEVKAFGDKIILGTQATVDGFAEALSGSRRWRSVHLACHGLVDHRRPSLSSLALTPTEDHGGELTALDVFHMRLPTDLAVLSACETGKGRIVHGEGIVGLTHSFLHAGASGVLVSLWKVDDEATRALMVKFYELWNPKEGKGPNAATALKQAQDYVRSQEKWKHPYFWAAWVLWGLP